MHAEAGQYVQRFATAAPLSVIEIGSRDINGTARDWFPGAEWTGLDIVDGPGVDVVCDAEAYHPPHAVDMVICCEVFEHAPRWRQIINSAAGWLKPGGRIVVTCAGPGRRPHSASGGRRLQDGEHYANVSPAEMAKAMDAAGLTEIAAEAYRNDCYATAVRPVARVTHNVLPDHIRLGAIASFPAADWSWWHRYSNGKLATVDPSRIPSGCMLALSELARVSVPPPRSFWDLDLYGAGLHVMPPGASLGRHVDAEHHPQRPWRRVASLVYFLEDVTGGELIIDDSTSITPEANTSVVMASDQWHEVAETHTPRRTLSLFAWALEDGDKGRTSAHFESIVAHAPEKEKRPPAATGDRIGSH